MDKYQKKFKEFKENMQGCILQVWQELNSEQKEMAEEIIMQAWEEEDTQGFRYSDQQLLACFLSNQILYPCSDAVFKAIFLNDEGYVLLKDLICWTIFQGQKKILDLTVLPSEQNISVFGDKIFHCDILVVLENNEKCNIEMQLTHHEGLSSRMVIQAAKLHVSQAKKGLEFLSIKPTLSLWIMPFDFTGFQDCYSSARLRFDQDSAKIMSDDMQFH
ncbi:MAG: PD-(D/E)XK nuclease family transposase, partial [Candidatus Brocadiae bacterium]|nr:PD-(D/E)XK nuclease family transposase [Candidatus Brocadiia bacterium]